MLEGVSHVTQAISAMVFTPHSERLSHGTAALFICISAALVVLSGLMSGLTISLLAMDEIEIEVRFLSAWLARLCSRPGCNEPS